MSVIGRLLVPPSYLLFTKSLSAYHEFAPARAANWFTKGCVISNLVYMIMHVKDPYLSVIRVGHRVPLAGFCLSLYGLHVLNRDVNIIQSIN